MNNNQCYEFCIKNVTQDDMFLKLALQLETFVQSYKVALILLCFSLNVDLLFMIFPNLYICLYCNV